MKTGTATNQKRIATTARCAAKDRRGTTGRPAGPRISRRAKPGRPRPAARSRLSRAATRREATGRNRAPRSAGRPDLSRFRSHRGRRERPGTARERDAARERPENPGNCRLLPIFNQQSSVRKDASRRRRFRLSAAAAGRERRRRGNSGRYPAGKRTHLRKKSGSKLPRSTTSNLISETVRPS